MSTVLDTLLSPDTYPSLVVLGVVVGVVCVSTVGSLALLVFGKRRIKIRADLDEDSRGFTVETAGRTLGDTPPEPPRRPHAQPVADHASLAEPPSRAEAQGGEPQDPPRKHQV